MKSVVAPSVSSCPQPAKVYSLECVGKTIDVLEALRRKGDLRLTDIAEATGLDKARAFRILYTLQERGYVVRDLHTKKFRLPLGHRKFRVGYAQPNAGHHFGDVVTQSLVKEAQRCGIELLVVDNRWDADEAVKNAHRLAELNVDFAIEFQVHYEVAPVIAEIFATAGIRTLTLGPPQPGAIYFGVDNYRAGLLCGEALARHATVHWRGRLDRLIFLEYPFVGRLTHSRFIGVVKGIQQVLPGFNRKQVKHLNAKGTSEGAYQATHKIMRSLAPRERVAIGGVNDDAAWGALLAIREAGREAFTAVMGIGFDAALGFVEEMRKPDSPLIGSVACFPEKYGPEALSIVTRCLNGEPVPPAVYTDHVLVTRENLDEMLAASHVIEASSARDVTGAVESNRRNPPRGGPQPELLPASENVR